MSWVHEAISSGLLFTLVFGMSATVEIEHLRTQIRNRKAILTGILVQFIILPFFGFIAVKALNMDSALGITLMVITSSPGGSYSNWWCSMFNADLALSVTMTAISTTVSTIMLPLNLALYARHIYEDDVVDNVDWASLFIALAIVISAIGVGLCCSAKIHSRWFNLLANKIGNLAGLSLIAFSIFVSHATNSHEKLWNHDWKFFVGVACPCVLGLATANVISTFNKLKKPERVTVSVESCYQNAGIATSVAINMFEGDQLAEAIAVPLYYGLVEAITLGIYCTFAWKMGWTKAPSDESFCTIITSTYENGSKARIELEGVEVVLGNYPKEGLPSDLVFELETAFSSDTDEEMAVGVSYPSPSRKVKDKEDSAVSTNVSIELQQERPLCSDLELTNIPITSPAERKLKCSPLEQKSLEEVSPQPQDKLRYSNSLNENISDIDNSSSRKQQPTLSRKLSAQLNRMANGDINGIQNGVYTTSPTEESDSDDLHSVEGPVIAIV